MPTSIASTFRKVASDGRIGKADVKQILHDALDGQGITKKEAEKLTKLREQYADRFTPQAAAAMDSALGKMKRSWSSTKKVHLPNVDREKLDNLIESDPRIGIYTRTRGSESSGSTRTRQPAPRPRRVSGGE